MNTLIAIVAGFAVLAAITSFPMRAWWHDTRAEWDQDELNHRTADFSRSDKWAANTALMISWHCDYADELRARSTLLRLWAGAKAAAVDMRKAMRRAA